MSTAPRRRRASIHEPPNWLGRREPVTHVAPPLDASRSRRIPWGRVPRRPLAVLAAAAELALLGWLLTNAHFTVRQVEVQGASRVAPAQLLAAAGIQPGASIFTVDPSSLAGNLRALPWVRGATVEAALPNRVVIHVAEWQPVAMYRAGGYGLPYYVTERGVVMDFDNRSGRPFEIDGPAGNDPSAGDRVIDPQLLLALVSIASAFPQLFGQQVQSYRLDACGNLVLVTQRGWQVQFGQTASPPQIGALHDKLAALKTVAGAIDLRAPTLDYVNVMNPSAPAVHRRAPGSHPSSGFPLPDSSGSISFQGAGPTGGIAVTPCR